MPLDGWCWARSLHANRRPRVPFDAQSPLRWGLVAPRSSRGAGPVWQAPEALGAAIMP